MTLDEKRADHYVATLPAGQARETARSHFLAGARETGAEVNHCDTHACSTQRVCSQCMIDLRARVGKLEAVLRRVIGDDVGCVLPPPNVSPDWRGYGDFHCSWCKAIAILATAPPETT